MGKEPRTFFFFLIKKKDWVLIAGISLNEEKTRRVASCPEPVALAQPLLRLCRSCFAACMQTQVSHFPILLSKIQKGV